MTLAETRKIVDAAVHLADVAVARATKLTESGARIDDHQVLAHGMALFEGLYATTSRKSDA